MPTDKTKLPKFKSTHRSRTNPKSKVELLHTDGTGCVFRHQPIGEPSGALIVMNLEAFDLKFEKDPNPFMLPQPKPAASAIAEPAEVVPDPASFEALYEKPTPNPEC